MAPSGGAEKKLNMGAQLQIITYKMPPKLKKCNNSISVSTNGGTAVRFWYHLYKLHSLSWHHVLGAHLQRMAYSAVVEIFYNFASKSPMW